MPILGHRIETSLKLKVMIGFSLVLLGHWDGTVELMWVLTPSPCTMMKIWTLLSSDLLGVGSRSWSENDWKGCGCVWPSLSYGLGITSLYTKQQECGVSFQGLLLVQLQQARELLVDLLPPLPASRQCMLSSMNCQLSGRQGESMISMRTCKKV